MDRLYCTINEMIDDLEIAGVKAWRESLALDKIRSASEYIDRELGMFIPLTEAKRLDGWGGVDLYVPPLLAVTSIVDDDDTLTSSDYLLYPRNRLWENGPYVRVTLDPDSTFGTWSYEEDIIVITGRWGLYEETEDTGATVSSQAADATSLVVSSAASISPGAVLKIDDEQELVTATGAATDSTADTSEALDVSEEEVDVSDGSQINTGEVIKVDFEQMRVVDKSTNTLLVLRGYNGTKRATHSSGANVYVYRTFTVKRGVNGTTAAAHSSDTIYRYLPPRDINALCRQMATLLMKKAATGYTGREGSAETGEAFYINEFPRSAIDELRRHYFLPLT